MTILVTGASGVVGTALLPRLRQHNVICLTHSKAIAEPGVTALRGDIRGHRLGLSPPAFDDLARSVDVIVHAAAVTDFGNSQITETNVVGTARVADLAAAAGARLIHVSSAFAGAGTPGDSPALAYAQSKAEAEAVVRSRGIPATVVRPSIVVGDSVTGQIARHQGFHRALGAVMRGLLPIAPLDPAWLLDFVPQDVVADAIAGLISGEHRGEDVWLTAGTRALSLGTVVAEATQLAAEVGPPVPPVRFVDPDMYRRLIAPVFLKAMSGPARSAIAGLSDHLSAYLARSEPFHSDLPSLPEPTVTLHRSMRRWAEITGFADRRNGRKDASRGGEREAHLARS